MSAGEKKHDYHLVDPSPWPIYTSFATLVLAVGSIYYFHSKKLIATFFEEANYHDRREDLVAA